MEAVFSDIETRIVGLLNQAQESIKIVAAWLTSSAILLSLMNKARSGVKIQIIISSSEMNVEDSTLLNSLIKLNSEIYIGYKNSPFIHHKFIIIDDKKLINGSYNLTPSAKYKFENVMIFNFEKENDEILNQFKDCFENLKDNHSKKLTSHIGDYTYGHFVVTK
ncbi:MAG: phospholipase D-like domain-containing protein [Bacteroidia bacterium]